LAFILGYAENLNAPFVILPNEREHWCWNLQRADQCDAYRIERLPSRDDLERLRLKNLQPPRPPQTEVVGPDYLRPVRHDLALRGYQVRAMDAIARGSDDQSRRKFLLELATGTGKTLLCAALIHRFLLTRKNLEGVLIPTPPLEVQRTFAACVADIRALQAAQAASRRRPDDLFQSWLQCALQGSLWPRRQRPLDSSKPDEEPVNAKTTAYLTLRFEGPKVKPGRIPDIEQVEPPETASTLAEGGPDWAYDFWGSPSAEEYARRQGTPVPSDPSQLYGPGEPADWAGFDEALERWRAESPVG